MSDFNSSQPVRTQNNGDVVVKVADSTTPTQQLAVDSSGRVIVKIQASNGDALTDTSGSLNVNVTNGLSSGTTDKTAFTYGTTAEQPIGGVYQDTSPTLTAGTSGAIRSTANRGLHVNLRDSSGNEKLGSSTSAASIPVVIASDQGAVPVSQSGTWTVQPGNTANSTPWLVTDSADGPVTAGTVAAKSSLAGVQYNSSAPTLTTGQQAAAQADSSGNLLVNVKTALPTGSNVIGAVTQSGGPWTATGTGTAGSPAAGVLTIQGIAGGTAIPISGSITATNPSVGTDGSAIPTSSTLIGASDGTNLQQLLVESSTNRNLRVGLYAGATEASVKAASTVAASTDTALVVALNPNNAQNTTAYLTQDAADGPVTAGTAATKSILTGGQYNTSLPTLTSAQQAALQVDASGRLIIRPLTSSDVVTSAQGTAASASAAWPVYETVGGTAVSASNPLPASVTVGGAAISPTNPLPVYMQDGGTSVFNYNTASSVAAAATSNHDYTVTSGKTLHLTQLHIAGSGKVKAEAQLETGSGTGTFNTFWVGFNSTGNPNIDITFSSPIEQVAGARVRIIRTNNDTASQDLYSTTMGHEQ